MKISELIKALNEALKHGDTDVVVIRQTGSDSWALVGVTDVKVNFQRGQKPYTVIA